MNFSMTATDLINLFFITSGIGICILCIMQIRSATYIQKEIRYYFQFFFLILLVYICMHLARVLMDGQPGTGIRKALQAVTLVEFLSSAYMSFLMSILVVRVAQVQKGRKKLEYVLFAVLCVHAVLMIADVFLNRIYYFDAANVYHRGPGYMLSNICPLIMLIIDGVLLIRYRSNIDRRVRIAFWIYLAAPILAIVAQSLFFGLQFIIAATVSGAVYMFSVILQVQTERFEKQRTESTRLETELNMASEIQANMLPNIFPAFPERREFDVYARMDPAKEVGGDFYDFFFTDETHLGIVMADVSGKGVPAALFMMISKTLVQNYALTGLGPKETLEAVNRQICENNRETMFVTIWFGLLDLESGRLTAVNAGHEYPVLKTAGGSFELVNDRHGLVVGAMSESRYKEYELQLEPGSKLFLYTDGLVEATNSENELFGKDRMVEALRTVQDAEPKVIVESVECAVSAYVKDAPQFDDLTMLCLEFYGKSGRKQHEQNREERAAK